MKKDIFIVLSNTGTIFGNTIRIFSEETFAHSSISLSEELKEMYSFGRIYPELPLPAGLIIESIESGFFKANQQAEIVVYRVEIDAEKHQALEKNILNFMKNQKRNIAIIFWV